MSPLTWVRPGLPPVFSAHGSHDELVPASQTASLTRALRAAGSEASDLFIDGGHHGFTPPQTDSAFLAVAEFLRKNGVIDP